MEKKEEAPRYLCWLPQTIFVHCEKGDAVGAPPCKEIHLDNAEAVLIEGEKVEIIK